MPGDPFKPVSVGQRLEIPAAAYNAFLDAARFARGRQHETDRDPDAFFRQTGIVKVRNATGFALPRFSVLALAEPIIGPQDDLAEFQTRATFEGIVPEDPPVWGRFAVLLDPLDGDAIGRGIVAGVTPVKLYVDPDRLYEFAEVAAGSTGSLRNLLAGSARVLWVDETGSSERWAIVRLGDGEDHVRFQLTAALARCGSAEANLVVYRDGKWCPVEATITVHDAVGLVCADLCKGDTGSGEGCDCPTAGSVPAGTFGVAKYYADSRKWEVVVLGEGCCSTSSSSSGGSSSGRSSGSSSGWSSSAWSSSGSGWSSSDWPSSSSSWPSSSGWPSSSWGSSSGWPCGSSGWTSSGSSWSGSGWPSSSGGPGSSGSWWWSSSGSHGSGSSWWSGSSSGSAWWSSSGSGSWSGSWWWSSSGNWPSSSYWPSSSGTPSGSGSGVGIIETDVQCEGGKLKVYKRTVTLRLEPGGLTSEAGTWAVSHEAGCCGCDHGSSSSSVWPSSSHWYSSSSWLNPSSSWIDLPSSSLVVLSSSSLVDWPSSWVDPPSSSDGPSPSSSSDTTWPSSSSSSSSGLDPLPSSSSEVVPPPSSWWSSSWWVEPPSSSLWSSWWVPPPTESSSHVVDPPPPPPPPTESSSFIE